ncbi:MAG: SCO family protein [Pseudomonadota bacterium]
MRAIVVTAVAAACIGALAASAVVFQDRIAATGGQIATSGKALIGGPFTLVDHNGRTVADTDFKGKPLLVFFGFTHCPDICPQSLQVLTEAMETLGNKADAVRPVFVSVDPERDTPENLKAYVEAFHPSIIGLTGTVDQVAGVVKAYRVYARKVALEGSAADYTMDHSAFIYLMDADGNFVRHFNHGIKPAALAEGLKDHLSG